MGIESGRGYQRGGKKLKNSLVLLFVIVIFSILVFPLSETQLYVKKEYDRFDGKTTISVDYSALFQNASPKKQPRILANISFTGETPPKDPPSVLITLTSINENWKYLDCTSTYCLLDDKPFKLPEVKYNGDVLDSGGVIENIVIIAPYSLFTKLCEASKLEFKICNTEFEISEFEKTCLKQVRALYEGVQNLI